MRARSWPMRSEWAEGEQKKDLSNWTIEIGWEPRSCETRLARFSVQSQRSNG
jgi:hypothetical protein